MHALGGGSFESIPVAGVLRDHRLIVVTKQGRTHSSFPRDPATRRRAPW
jgi:hypothetical protein